jgi:hypothetical protein
VSLGDFLDYVSSLENWSDEDSRKQTQAMLYSLKYDIWSNKEASWLLEGERQWLATKNLSYSSSAKMNSRKVTSYCRLLTRKKEEIMGRVEAREVKASGMVVRKKAIKEDFWKLEETVGCGGKGIFTFCLIVVSLVVAERYFHFLIDCCFPCVLSL